MIITAGDQPWPAMSGDEYLQAVIAVLRSGFTSEGPEVELLEKEFAEWLSPEDPPYAVAVFSGTLALEAALEAIRLPSGSEVIVPAVSYMASATAIQAAGFKPVFVDVDPDRGLIDPEALLDVSRRNVSAVLPVDLDGHPYPEEVDHIARQYGWAVIEDACPAHGSMRRQDPAGLLGKIGAFSFNQSKIMPAGEGGMLITRSAQIADRARLLRRCGERGDALTWRFSETTGHNWYMSDVTASLARVSLARIGSLLDCAVSNTEMLDQELGDCDVIGSRAEDDPICSVVPHKYRAVINIGDKKEILRILEEAGVPVIKAEVAPLPAHPAFASSFMSNLSKNGPRQRDWLTDNYPGAVTFLEQTVVIGSKEHPLWWMTSEKAYSIGAAIRRVFQNMRDFQ